MPKDVTVRPDDLITAKEAAKMAGKKKDTIRSWVRKSKITGYREDPNNSNSALMVSEAELRLYLGGGCNVTHPNNKGRPEIPSVSLELKDKEIELLKKELELSSLRCKAVEDRFLDLQGFNTSLQNTLNLREQDIVAQNNRMDVMELQHSELQQKYNQLQVRCQQLMTYLALPWWKRMTSALLLEDKN